MRTAHTAASQPITIGSSPRQIQYDVDANGNNITIQSDSARMSRYMDIGGDRPSYNRFQDDQDGSNDEQHREDQQLTSAFHDMTVGSLPSIRRERRFMVSNGNHEFYLRNQRIKQNSSGSAVLAMAIGEDEMYDESGDGVGGSENRQDSRHDKIFMARSLPVPSAPFLASRNSRTTRDQLSR